MFKAGSRDREDRQIRSEAQYDGPLVSSVQSNLFNSSQMKSHVKGQPEKMSLKPCWKLTATDGRGAKVKRQ